MLGKRLKQFAQEAYGSLNGLSDKTGIGRTQLSSYTTGSRSPGVDVLEKLLKAGCNLNWLIGGVGASVYSDEYIKDDSHAESAPPLSEYEILQIRAVIKANAKALEEPRLKKKAG